MRYLECLDYLDCLGTEVAVAKSGLDNIRKILEGLGNPQCCYPSVLIAGTNGKGSVAAFLSSILSTSGLRAGLYTSPHLVSVDERIAVDGRQISPDTFADCLSRTVEAIQKLHFPCHPTFFETVTSAAFLFFAEVKVDIAVVEAGMGGRTDSTNILEPVVSVITPISIDHQQYLGETIEAIACQKAGIIHQRGVVITAPQKSEVASILEREAAEQAAVLWYANDGAAVVTSCPDGRYRFTFGGLEFAPRLYGRHQVGNAVLAISAAGLLREKGYSITPAALTEGVNHAFVAGRIQKISDSPVVFLDGAHNDEALAKLVEFVTAHTAKPRSLVFALMADKRLSSSIDLLAQCFARIYLTRPCSERAASCDHLLREFPGGLWIENPIEALRVARQKSETVVVAGSLYLVGEILQAESGRNTSERVRRKSPSKGEIRTSPE
jgi:dihydrofolate synthase/folylpolyglutamate synthase